MSGATMISTTTRPDTSPRNAQARQEAILPGLGLYNIGDNLPTVARVFLGS